ncbi:MAG: hypothetical protein HY741_11885 [Chloroflexi bacterium]|nr:hypothetical protein [Chloroflexota bacterium]
MANPSPQRKRRIIVFAGLGVIVLCLCVVIGLSALLLMSSAGSAPSQAPRTAPAAALATSSAGQATALPRATATVAQVTGAPAQSTLAPSAPPTVSAQPTEVVAQPATGDLHFDYPLTLAVDQDDIVKVEIVPDQTVALAAPLNAPAVSARLLVESGADQLAHNKISYSIPVYPVMSAELSTARNQDLIIVAGSESKQLIAPHDANFWTWSLVAKRGGEYRVTLRIFGYNQLADPDPVRRVVDDTRIVTVQERVIGDRLMQGLADNWLVLFGAGGPIALVVLILSLYFSRRDVTRPSNKA